MTVTWLTPDRWADLERLFGPRGACGGCWCMFDRLPRAVFDRQKGEGNRAAFHARVDAGPPPGVLAYDGDEPVGWCAVAPRAEYVRLARSRILAPVDDAPAWSITCFYVARTHRRSGLGRILVEAALALASAHGARCVEAYPVDPGADPLPDAFAWHGLPGPFLAAGFREVARRSAKRPFLRIDLSAGARRRRS